MSYLCFNLLLWTECDTGLDAIRQTNYLIINNTPIHLAVTVCCKHCSTTDWIVLHFQSLDWPLALKTNDLIELRYSITQTVA